MTRKGGFAAKNKGLGRVNTYAENLLSKSWKEGKHFQVGKRLRQGWQPEQHLLDNASKKE